MTNPNRPNYEAEEDEAGYCAASEGRFEHDEYVPDIWHAVAISSDGPSPVAECGAQYEPAKLSVEVSFASRPESQKCGGCLARVGSPLNFLRN